MSKYRVTGYAQTRDALTWVMLSAPDFKYGLTLEDVYNGILNGYMSVRPKLKDIDRVELWETSLRKFNEAFELFRKGNQKNGRLTMQEADELFSQLRRIGGKKALSQELADTEHGANELDE